MIYPWTPDPLSEVDADEWAQAWIDWNESVNNDGKRSTQ